MCVSVHSYGRGQLTCDLRLHAAPRALAHMLSLAAAAQAANWTHLQFIEQVVIMCLWRCGDRVCVRHKLRTFFISKISYTCTCQSSLFDTVKRDDDDDIMDGYYFNILNMFSHTELYRKTHTYISIVYYMNENTVPRTSTRIE